MYNHIVVLVENVFVKEIFGITTIYVHAGIDSYVVKNLFSI